MNRKIAKYIAWTKLISPLDHTLTFYDARQHDWHQLTFNKWLCVVCVWCMCLVPVLCFHSYEWALSTEHITFNAKYKYFDCAFEEWKTIYVKKSHLCIKAQDKDSGQLKIESFIHGKWIYQTSMMKMWSHLHLSE